MPGVRKLNKSQTRRLQLFEDVGRILRRIIKRDVMVDIDQVVLGVLDNPDAVALQPACSLMRLRIFEKAFLAGLLRPSWRLLLLCASIFRRASDSCVCS